MRGEEVVRMVPYKDGKANRGHSCVKGRFAWGYTNHKERILNPMIRNKITDPWREVSWDEAFDYAASEFKRIQTKYGRDSIGGITSSRCTNEETYLVQQLIRAGFGNNNVDTCARVCHSPTGYGLATNLRHLGRHPGLRFSRIHRRRPDHRRQPDRRASVFASRMKKRLRAGAKLIVVDPRRTDIVRSTHIEAQHHLPLMPGTNVAVLTAMAHVIVTEGLVDETFVRERCDWSEFQDWAQFRRAGEEQPGSDRDCDRRRPKRIARRGTAVCHRRQWRDLLRARRHRTQPGLHDGHRDCQSRHGDRQYRPARRRREPAARPEQTFRAPATWVRSRTNCPAIVTISGDAVRESFESIWNVKLNKEPGLADSQHVRCRDRRAPSWASMCRAKTSCRSDPNTKHVVSALSSMECVIVHDLFLNETANLRACVPAGIDLPGKRRYLTNAERRIQRVRKVTSPRNGLADWESHHPPCQGDGLRDELQPSVEIMDEIAALTPTFAAFPMPSSTNSARYNGPATRKTARHAGHAHRWIRARQGQVRHHRIYPHRRAYPGRASRCS